MIPFIINFPNPFVLPGYRKVEVEGIAACPGMYGTCSHPHAAHFGKPPHDVFVSRVVVSWVVCVCVCVFVSLFFFVYLLLSYYIFVSVSFFIISVRPLCSDFLSGNHLVSDFSCNLAHESTPSANTQMRRWVNAKS